MNTTPADYIKLHFIVFLFGFTAILGKLISLPSVEMVFYRTLFAAVGMAALIYFKKGSFAVSSAKDFWTLAGTGLIVALHWITFFASGKISNPSVSLVGFATCSFWAAIIEPLAKGKKIRPLEVGLGVAVLIGLALIFSFDFNYPLGLALGIASGLTAAVFSVINSKLVTRLSSYTITLYEMVAACLGIILFLPFYQFYFSAGSLQLSPTWQDWIYIALLGWVCSVYAYSQMVNLMLKLSVFFIQLALNLEPVYGIVFAILIFGKKEVMGWNFYAGTTIILAAVALYPVLKNRYGHQFNTPLQ
ncbi:MAG: DMT family transporter [Bacteroidetes bacterium]|nr:DMT family transporter [Bacteroidota bacterium]MBS1539390.1 DMT family transporter [Bacteroidota bacterium]